MGDIQLLRMALEAPEVDCELTIVTDGGGALALVRNAKTWSDSPRVDLAVLDLNLPKNDGVEVLQAMR